MASDTTAKSTYRSSVFVVGLPFCCVDAAAAAEDEEDDVAAGGDFTTLINVVTGCPEPLTNVEKPNDRFFSLALVGSFLVAGDVLEASDMAPSSSSLSTPLPLILDDLLLALRRRGGLSPEGAGFLIAACEAE